MSADDKDKGKASGAGPARPPMPPRETPHTVELPAAELPYEAEAAPDPSQSSPDAAAASTASQEFAAPMGTTELEAVQILEIGVLARESGSDESSPGLPPPLPADILAPETDKTRRRTAKALAALGHEEFSDSSPGARTAEVGEDIVGALIALGEREASASQLDLLQAAEASDAQEGDGEPKADEPQPETPQAEEPRAEEPRAEEPQEPDEAERTRADEAEEPQADEAEEPQADEAEETQAEEPEEPEPEEPEPQEPQPQEPQAEEPEPAPTTPEHRVLIPAPRRIPWHKIDYRAALVLSRVDGRRTQGELIALSGLDADLAEHFIADLLEQGLIIVRR